MKRKYYNPQINLPRNSGYDSKVDTLKHKKDVYDHMDAFIKEFKKAVESPMKHNKDFFDILALAATRDIQSPKKLTKLKKELIETARSGPIILSQIDNTICDFNSRNIEFTPSAITAALDYRAFTHDNTKIEKPDQKHLLDLLGPRNNTNPDYGTHEYYARIGDFCRSHHANSTHHPEHFENGVSGMTLIDFIEHLCDTNGARIRYGNGDIVDNIANQAKKYKYTQNFFNLCTNTNKRLGLID